MEERTKFESLFSTSNTESDVTQLFFVFYLAGKNSIVW